MGWLSRILSPDSELLRNAIERAACLESKLDSEIIRNRLREDSLVDQILQLAGAKRAPFRELLPEAPEPEPEGLTESDKQILYDRAKEVCLQTIGSEFTEDQLLQNFAAMKADPATWLRNY